MRLILECYNVYLLEARCSIKQALLDLLIPLDMRAYSTNDMVHA